MAAAGRLLPNLARLHGFGFVVDVPAVRAADLDAGDEDEQDEALVTEDLTAEDAAAYTAAETEARVGPSRWRRPPLATCCARDTSPARRNGPAIRGNAT